MALVSERDDLADLLVAGDAVGADAETRRRLQRAGSATDGRRDFLRVYDQLLDRWFDGLVDDLEMAMACRLLERVVPAGTRPPMPDGDVVAIALGAMNRDRIYARILDAELNQAGVATRFAGQVPAGVFASPSFPESASVIRTACTSRTLVTGASMAASVRRLGRPVALDAGSSPAGGVAASQIAGIVMLYGASAADVPPAQPSEPSPRVPQIVEAAAFGEMVREACGAGETVRQGHLTVIADRLQSGAAAAELLDSDDAIRVEAERAWRFARSRRVDRRRFDAIRSGVIVVLGPRAPELADRLSR